MPMTDEQRRKHDQQGVSAMASAITVWWLVVMLAIDGRVHPMGAVVLAAGILSVVNVALSAYHAYQATR